MPLDQLAPRISPGSRRQLRPLNWLLVRVLSWVTGTSTSQLFGTVGRCGGLFRRWLIYGARLMPGGAIDPRYTELAILRVASLRNCAYIVQHHRDRARRIGVDARALTRVEVGSMAPDWAPIESTLLALVEAMTMKRDVPDVLWDSLRLHFTERDLIEICLLVGHYDALATLIAVLRIQPDQPRSIGRRPTLRRVS